MRLIRLLIRWYAFILLHLGARLMAWSEDSDVEIHLTPRQEVNLGNVMAGYSPDEIDDADDPDLIAWRREYERLTVPAPCDSHSDSAPCA